jgi:hypothetical protein
MSVKLSKKEGQVKTPSKQKKSSKGSTTVMETKGTVAKSPVVKATLPPPEVSKEQKPQVAEGEILPEPKKLVNKRIRQPSTKTRGLINNRKIGVRPGMTLVFRPNDNIKVTALDDTRTFDVNGEKIWGISIAEKRAFELAKIEPPKRLYGWNWDRLNEDGTRTPVKQIFESLPTEDQQDPEMAKFKDKKDSPVWVEPITA